MSVTKIQVADPKARRVRGGYRTTDRVLREVLGRRRFEQTTELLELVPTGLPAVFTTADLAHQAGVGRDVAQQMAYCFRSLGLFHEQGRTRAGIEYSLSRGHKSRRR